MTKSTKGYERFVRGDGSVWYLCDDCEKIGFCAGTEEKMKQHHKEVHG